MNARILSSAGITVAALSAGCMATRPPPMVIPGQHAQSFEMKIAATVHAHYLLYLPEGYGQSRDEWPLMLFLHGSGERGTDLSRVAVHGPPKLAATGTNDVPFIIVSPQCPEQEWWTSARQIDVLNALLDDVVTSPHA